MLRFLKFQISGNKANSVKKYVGYALGEMILIIISLLLALQLNQFNTNRIKEKKRQYYIQQLAQDLQQDLKSIENATIQINKELDLIDRYEKRLNHNTAKMDTLIKIAKTEFNPNFPRLVRFTRNTQETLKSTGDIGLISNEVLEALAALNELQEAQYYYQQMSLESHNAQFEDYLNNYGLYAGLIKKGPIYNEIWQNIDGSDLALKFNAIQTIKLSTLTNAKYNYQRIEQETNRVIEVLKTKI